MLRSHTPSHPQPTPHVRRKFCRCFLGVAAHMLQCGSADPLLGPELPRATSATPGLVQQSAAGCTISLQHSLGWIQCRFLHPKLGPGLVVHLACMQTYKHATHAAGMCAGLSERFCICAHTHPAFSQAGLWALTLTTHIPVPAWLKLHCRCPGWRHLEVMRGSGGGHTCHLGRAGPSRRTRHARAGARGRPCAAGPARWRR